jgi:hypothetical protein
MSDEPKPDKGATRRERFVLVALIVAAVVWLIARYVSRR